MKNSNISKVLGGGQLGATATPLFGGLLDSPDQQLEGMLPTCSTEVFVGWPVALEASICLKNLLSSCPILEESLDTQHKLWQSSPLTQASKDSYRKSRKPYKLSE